MSTLIVYSSKHGYTKQVAGKLAGMLDGEVDIVNLKDSQPDPEPYDTVIIGGSIYVGKMQKAVGKYCDKYFAVLREKNLGLFICGMAEGEDLQKEMMLAFPIDLIDVAAAFDCLGGEFDFEKLGAVSSMIVKKISGSGENQVHERAENIEKFVQTIKAREAGEKDTTGKE